MTIKVVRGLVNSTKPNQSQSNAVRVVRGARGAVTSAVSSAGSSSAVSSDASVNGVRAGRLQPKTERIRDSREAKEIAHDVAEQVRHEEGGRDVHSYMEPVMGRGYFLN